MQCVQVKSEELKVDPEVIRSDCEQEYPLDNYCPNAQTASYLCVKKGLENL